MAHDEVVVASYCVLEAFADLWCCYQPELDQLERGSAAWWEVNQKLRRVKDAIVCGEEVETSAGRIRTSPAEVIVFAENNGIDVTQLYHLRRLEYEAIDWTALRECFDRIEVRLEVNDRIKQEVESMQNGMLASLSGQQTAVSIESGNSESSEATALPPEYREGGKSDGEPLMTAYLRRTSDWNLRADYITRNYSDEGDKPLTNRIKVGNAYAYMFTELSALRRLKTEGEDPGH